MLVHQAILVLIAAFSPFVPLRSAQSGPAAARRSEHVSRHRHGEARNAPGTRAVHRAEGGLRSGHPCGEGSVELDARNVVQVTGSPNLSEGGERRMKGASVVLLRRGRGRFQ